MKRLWNIFLHPLRRVAMWWVWRGPKVPFGLAPRFLGFAMGGLKGMIYEPKEEHETKKNMDT